MKKYILRRLVLSIWVITIDLKIMIIIITYFTFNAPFPLLLNGTLQQQLYFLKK